MIHFGPLHFLDLAVKFIASLAITAAMELNRLLPVKGILAVTLIVLIPLGLIFPLSVMAVIIGTEALAIFSYVGLRYHRDAKSRCMKLTRRCEQNPRNIYYRYDQRGLDTPECCAAHLIHILFFTCEILEENGIPYFICFGTLLGALRNGGMIPWDTDCDISVPEAYRPQLQKLAWTFIRHGLWVYEQDRSFTIQYGTNGINSLHTDIYLSRPLEGNRIECDDQAGIAEDDIYPLRKLPFYDRFLWAPNRSEKVLADYYGPECLRMARKKYVKDSGPSPMTEAGKAPAKLAYPLW